MHLIAQCSHASDLRYDYRPVCVLSYGAACTAPTTHKETGRYLFGDIAPAGCRLAACRQPSTVFFIKIFLNLEHLQTSCQSLLTQIDFGEGGRGRGLGSKFSAFPAHQKLSTKFSSFSGWREPYLRPEVSLLVIV
jgi:hypothetical protein